MKRQQWRISAATSDQFDYTHDYAGNRLTRDIPSSLYAGDDRDQKLAHDNLHRLKTFDEGTHSMGNISPPTFEEDYTLDELGNWTNLVKKTGGTISLEGAGLRFYGDLRRTSTAGDGPFCETHQPLMPPTSGFTPKRVHDDLPGNRTSVGGMGTDNEP